MMQSFRILIVDDDPVISDLLQETLMTEGYTVSRATNGAEALELMQDAVFHLLITDFSMPAIDGLTLLKISKRLMPHLQVILMTASREKKVLDEAVRLGVYVVLSKPVGQKEILKTVKEILENKKCSTGQVGMINLS